ncbi:MAG: polyketide synthase [Anaerolineae bacterium]|nr:MAG: polyketide synthase [Anaerolineae bacterium]WKZ44871.1 MAG: beta-ketoacyl synthase N-terminal-like domain-containing protein [Anaerolineales bacterium]
MTKTPNPDLSPVKRALQEVLEMRARLEAMEHASHEPIAVIGMACRYPGRVNTVDDFWRLLSNGADAITEVPGDRWDNDSFYDPDPDAAGKMITRWGGFLEQIDRFDAQFFGLSPREAEGLDPQHRLLLECAWEALEAASQAPDRLTGSKVGVFLGIASLDYYQIMAGQDHRLRDVYFAQGTTHSVAAGRISYFLGLQGPAVSIDTACSSSLVAVHLAAQSLRSGESRMALVGGVNVILLPDLHISFSKAGMLSADGRCKTFDARADGYVRSEGCGMVVLKRLSDALADNDTILAVIRGTGVNQDGRSNGLTAPNGLAQEAVIRAALDNGGVDASAVSYVEAHGTGTSLGDPIEVQALGAVYGSGRPTDRRLKIGSVKTNLGHLEAAAGIAALMKSVLIMQHKQIPPSLHFETPNPYIPWQELPIDVTTQLTDLPASKDGYFVGVSSFGFSGTNSHVVLEAAPELPSKTADMQRPLHLLKISAKDKTALKNLAGQFVGFLSESQASLADISFAANAGRADLPQRIALVASSSEQAREKLRAFVDDPNTEEVFCGAVFDTAAPEIAFLFTGHGSQYVHMGEELFKTQPAFRAALQECEELLKFHLDVPLTEILFPTDGVQRLDTMMYGQPALFAIEYALAQMWMSWGIRPTTVLGHSVGEYVAACIAGVFSLADGLKLVSARGRLMDSLPASGEMLAVFASEAVVQDTIATCGEAVSIAALNGPTNIVVSGSSEAIASLLGKFEDLGIQTRRLAVSQAAHSHFLDPILDEFESVAETIEYARPRLGFVSCLSGSFANGDEVTHAGYWRRHLRQPVRFADGMHALFTEGYHHFIEIGPHPVLSGMAQRLEQADGRSFIPSLRSGWQDWQQVLESAAILYTQGISLDWKAFDHHYARKPVSIPTYPWSRQRYWVEGQTSQLLASPQRSVWQASIEAADYEANRGPLDLAIESHSARWDTLDRLAVAYIVHALRELGFFTKSGDSFSAEAILAQAAINPVYLGLMKRWLNVLSESGLLVRNDSDVYVAQQPLPESDSHRLLQEAQALYKDERYLPDYLERCGQALVNILKGADSPLDTLFPGGSYETADYLYHNSSIARYFNGIARAIVGAGVVGQTTSGPLRILEVGAGTGGTTAALLPILPAERTVYAFTDLSEYFFKQAEEKFKEYAFLQFGILDMEKSPEEQGYDKHSFHLVVGANIFHATRNLDEALQHARSLLAPGGMLLLYETTEQQTWFETSISLIEGWSRFEDKWRRDIPLLSTEQWHEALLANGFVAVVSWPGPGMPTEILEARIILAQAPLDIPIDRQNSTRGSSQHTGRVSQPEESLDDGIIAFLERLNKATSEERELLLIDYVRSAVMRVTRCDPSNPPDRRQRLMEFGVDSLMAVDLRNRLTKGLGLSQPLPATLIFDYPTIETLARYLENRLFKANASTVRVTEKPDPMLARQAEIESLSEEDVEALLLNKLKDVSNDD